jgi:hypothetical protein
MIESLIVRFDNNGWAAVGLKWSPSEGFPVLKSFEAIALSRRRPGFESPWERHYTDVESPSWVFVKIRNRLLAGFFARRKVITPYG